MKRSKIILSFLLFPLLLRATPEISMEIYRYMASSGPYVEVSIYVAGPSLAATGTDTSEYGIHYTLIIHDEGGAIVAGSKYRLSATGAVPSDIIDVKRFALARGKYKISMEAVDVADSLSVIAIEQDIDLSDGVVNPYLSDPQLASVVSAEQPASQALNKSGLYLEPLAFRLYYPSLNQLILYQEIYQADQLEGQPYLQYTIASAVGEIPPPIVAYKKLKKEAVIPNVFQLDITTLISGPFVLETKLFDGNKVEKASTQIHFSRLNPKGDSIYVENAPLLLDQAFVNKIPGDSLDYFMRALAPIVNSIDVDVMNALLEKGNDNAKRFFLHRFWTTQAGKQAEAASAKYMQIARAVDESFRSGFGYGFETDRGHVFLKYGMPDEVIEEENDPSAPPYEIWFYTTFPATHQSNVRFLFYNPSLAKNGYKLLHSTAIGEVKNERWEIELYRDATLETPGVTEKVMGDNVYRNARRYFEN